MTIDTVEKLDEMRAIVMAEKDSGPQGSMIFSFHWEEFGDGYLSSAKTIREADERAGLVTTPREPTEFMWTVMRNNGCNNPTAIREVIKASPFAPKVTK